jgi:uncharacterized protein YdeI (YjbR/CyaY-like superfamily)
VTPRFFKSIREFRRWLEKNHSTAREIWVGFHKTKNPENDFTQKAAFDQALCFGWTNSVIKGIDPFTYMIKYVPRRAGGTWSGLSMKRFAELKRQGLVRAAGVKSFEGRDRATSKRELPGLGAAHLKLFRANPKAWEFFNSQPPSYRRYTAWWVVSAKREETRLKRLQMLIEDSGNGSKLRRVVKAMEKVKKRHPPGQTPIEEGRNLGPVSGGELRSIGIDTVEKLRAVGWEQAFLKIFEAYPHRLHLNMVFALIGAIEDQDWRKIDGALKAEAKSLVAEIKREWR